MKYRLNPSINKIISSIILIYDEQEVEFASGKDAADTEFDKNYIVKSLFAQDDKIVIVLKENDAVNNTNWVGEEQVSFF